LENISQILGFHDFIVLPCTDFIFRAVSGKETFKMMWLFGWYRESNLSIDQPARNLFARAGPLLATKHSLSHLTLAAMLPYLNSAACLAWLVVLEICTNTVRSVVKYGVQKLNIVLNRNYSYTIHLYSFLHGGNAIESFVGSILTAQCHVKQ
jgi:hypothetical protein